MVGGRRELGQSLGWEARPPSYFFPGMVLIHCSGMERCGHSRRAECHRGRVCAEDSEAWAPLGWVLHPCLGPGHTPAAPGSPSLRGRHLPKGPRFLPLFPPQSQWLSCACPQAPTGAASREVALSRLSTYFVLSATRRWLLWCQAGVLPHSTQGLG